MSQMNRQLQEREVYVDRLKAVATVAANLVKHRVEHAEAVTNYPAAVVVAIKEYQVAISRLDFVEDVEENLKQLRRVQNKLDLPPAPVSYAEHYENMLMILEAETRDVVPFVGREVGCLMHDKWDWKIAFDVTNAAIRSYSSKA